MSSRLYMMLDDFAYRKGGWVWRLWNILCIAGAILLLLFPLVLLFMWADMQMCENHPETYHGLLFCR